MAGLEQYKKTYEGDYSKSYRDYLAWKKEGAEKKRIYQEISKKTNTRYNKSERSDYYNTTGNLLKDSERVYADGRGNRRTGDRNIKRDWDQPYTKENKPPKVKAEETYKPQTTTSKPKPQPIPSNTTKTAEDIARDFRESAYNRREQVKKEEQPKKPTPIEVEDDGNYNYIDYPIQQTGINSYKNLKTGKTLDTDGARNILKIAGFAPKSKASIGSVIFGFIIVYIVFSKFAPFVAIAYGAYRISMRDTTWIKQTSSKLLRFNMQASKEELTFNRQVGIACIVIGAIIALYNYSAV